VKCSKEKYGLYLHIPFCFSKCKYCHFYSITDRSEETIKQYIHGLQREIEHFKKFNFKFETLYVGGGTPNSIPPRDLYTILDLLHNNFDLKTVKEKSIEINPENLNEELLNILKEFNFNRLSIGVQSFNDEELKILGRLHNSEKAIKSIHILHEAGFYNINIDLLFAFKGQTAESFEKTLNIAVSLPVTHISTYSMTYEKGSLENLENKNEKFFEKLIKMRNSILTKNGFRWYEISNFARKGFECIHNLKYWLRHYYIGLGPSAAGFYSINGVEYRYKNPESLTKYISGNRTVEKLREKDKITEEIFLKIRTKFGVKLEQDFVESIKNQLKDLVSVKKNSLRLSEKGILVADAITVKILELYEDYKKRAQV
jgi:oxygen-independent coproporphyrinogen-3 oxidase